MKRVTVVPNKKIQHLKAVFFIKSLNVHCIDLGIYNNYIFKNVKLL